MADSSARQSEAATNGGPRPAPPRPAMTNAPATVNAAATNVFVPHSFSHPIPEKLEATNFLNWRRQVLAAVKGYRLQKYLLGPQYIPPQFASDEDEARGVFSEDFLNWESQDSLLLSWLLTSMTQSISDLVIECEYSHEVWDRLQVHFSSKTRAKVNQYRTQLRTMKKGSLSLFDYLLQIKKLANALSSVGSPITITEHIEAIFQGLDEDYDSFITSMNTRA